MLAHPGQQYETTCTCHCLPIIEITRTSRWVQFEAEVQTTKNISIMSLLCAHRQCRYPSNLALVISGSRLFLNTMNRRDTRISSDLLPATTPATHSSIFHFQNISFQSVSPAPNAPFVTRPHRTLRITRSNLAHASIRCSWPNPKPIARNKKSTVELANVSYISFTKLFLLSSSSFRPRTCHLSVTSTLASGIVRL